MKRVLLVRPDRAGDAIKTLPALRALVAQAPSLEITLLASEYNDSLFTLEPSVQLLVLPHRWERLETPELAVALSKLLPNPFDVAIGLPADPSPELARLMPLLPARRQVSVLSTPPFSSPVARDERENIASLITQGTGVDLNPLTVSAAPLAGEADRREAEQMMGEKRGRWIAITPFASHAHRSLSTPTILALINALGAHPAITRVVLPGGPGDRDRLEQLKQGSRFPEKVQPIFPSTFRALGAFLDRCDGLVSVDTGPLHLAVALEMPVLGFLGGCDQARWYPMKFPRFTFVRRGYFGRFPTRLGVLRHLRRWLGAKSWPQAER